MLYITTRNNNDAYTAYRSLRTDLAPDGGCFVPFRLPVYSSKEIDVLRGQRFSDTLAQMMNTFFSARLDGMDLELSVGRNLMKLVSLGQRIVVGELWHNMDSSVEYITRKLYSKVFPEETGKPTEWFRIAVGIAILFGCYGEADTKDVMDIAVGTEDMTIPMAAWYAREMGLPLGTIVYACEEDSEVWSLLYRGSCNAARVPDKQPGLERLIAGSLGMEQANRFAQKTADGRIYTVPEESLPGFREDSFVAAVSNTRLDSVIKSVERTDAYRIDPGFAAVYGSLQDYRASTGESRVALLLATKEPR